MSSHYQRCRRCGEYGWEATHKCAPLWHVRPEDYDRSEEHEAFGNDPEAAAVNFMEHNFDRMDYPKSITLIVVNESENEQWKIDIEVEAVPQFNASVVENKPIESETQDAQ